MSITNNIKRQAVVVIHGAGKPRPMETLRNFVAAVKQELEDDDYNEQRATVRSKPDSVGDIYETVRLSMSGTDTRPVTDFYEFYWAHNMHATAMTNMTGWLKQMIFRPMNKVPPGLKKVWITAWVLIVIAPIVAFIAMSAYTNSILSKLAAVGVVATVFPFVMSAVINFFLGSFFNFMGDAASYFTPDPDSIGTRAHIRQQGIQFLDKLHKIGETEKVDRIIIVAHCLGSVIAYDLVRLLWTQYNTTFDPALVGSQEKLLLINKYANGDIPVTEDNLERFQQLQYECWNEQRAGGNKWLISDFITLGASINALDYFMVTKEKLDTLKMQRELPICPPIKDEKDNAIIFDTPVPPGSKQVKILNHGALFAVIRWTNIYFTSDYVGGAVQRFFGPGAKDVPIERSSPWIIPGGHTSYWDKDDPKNALHEIVVAMKL